MSKPGKICDENLNPILKTQIAFDIILDPLRIKIEAKKGVVQEKIKFRLCKLVVYPLLSRAIQVAKRHKPCCILLTMYALDFGEYFLRGEPHFSPLKKKLSVRKKNQRNIFRPYPPFLFYIIKVL